MRIRRYPVIFFLFFAYSLFSQARPLMELFPASTAEQRIAAFNQNRYLYYGRRMDSLTLPPSTMENTKITKSALGPNPGFFVEALRIVPQRNVTLVRIYNSLRNIQGLKGRVYFSASSKKNVPLFTDAIRIEGPEKLKSFLPDPLPAASVPYRETFYARLTDVRFGNCYYEISLAGNQRGILYKITNFRNVNFGPFPVMKARTFTALIYIEPVEEGLALYCLTGAEVSDFIAKYVDIGSALNKRLDVFIAWMLEGI